MDAYPLMPMLPASDLQRARRWYEEKLGLTPVEESEETGLEYEAGGARFSVYPSSFAGTNQATAAGWEVEDIEKLIDDLIARGAVFEQYDLENLKTDERGLATIGGYRAAWLKDSEGNILGLTERRA